MLDRCAPELPTLTVLADEAPQQTGEGWQSCGVVTLAEYSLADAAAARATNDDPEFRRRVAATLPGLWLVRPSWCEDPQSPLGDHTP